MDRERGRPKTITRKSAQKYCQGCDKMIPVACKTCACGFIFKSKVPSPKAAHFSTHASKPISGDEPASSVKRRRTERVRRERPDYFNPLEYVSAVPRRRRTSTSVSSGPEETPKKKRGRPRQNKPKEDNGLERIENDKEKPDEDIFANLSDDKQQQFKVILSEINRKGHQITFKPS